jgi:uncharacterized protein (TIGR04141 family)
LSVDLTLFLFKPTEAALDHLIPEEKRGPDAFEKVPVRDGFEAVTEFSCWVKKTEPQPTSWCDWLEEGFVFGERRPQTQSSGCVILLKAADRVFAVCFGTGHHAVPGEFIEREFGLTVALNEVNPKQHRAMVTKSIDVKTRQRDTRHVAGAEVPEFALDLDMEWLRAAEGHTDRRDCNVVAGADSLHLRGWKRPLADLPLACADFLAIFSRGVPESFQFADSVKPIHESDPLHDRLEGDLYAAMQLRYFEVISVGIDAKVAHSASKYFVVYDRERWEINGLDDDSLMHGLDQVHAYQENFDPERVLLLLLDAEGDQVLRDRLDRLIQMEIDRDGDTYVRIERRWFRCREDYIRRVNERVAALEDITAALLMPVWDKTAHPREELYNDHAAMMKGWLLQDQVFWYRGDERIEPCDLLTPDCHLIHVKDGSASSALSHLFGQASGSADLLSRHHPFFLEMKHRYEAKWVGTRFEDAGKPKVVLAIARPSGAELFGKMLLSRLNVLEHARRVQSRGFEFAVCRVDLA